MSYPILSYPNAEHERHYSEVAKSAYSQASRPDAADDIMPTSTPPPGDK